MARNFSPTAANEKNIKGIVIITDVDRNYFSQSSSPIIQCVRERVSSKWRQYVTASLNRYYYVENLFRAVVHLRQSQSSISLSPFDSLKWILRDYMLHQVALGYGTLLRTTYKFIHLDADSYFPLSSFLFSRLSMVYANLERQKFSFKKMILKMDII